MECGCAHVDLIVGRLRCGQAQHHWGEAESPSLPADLQRVTWWCADHTPTIRCGVPPAGWGVSEVGTSMGRTRSWTTEDHGVLYLEFTR
jgi:hypothetical protein